MTAHSVHDSKVLFIDSLEKLLESVLEGELQNRSRVKLERPAEVEHGDFSCNIALRLFGELKKLRGSESSLNGLRSFSSAKEIAIYLVTALQQNQKAKLWSVFSRLEVAGSGFINAYLSDSYVVATLHSNKLQLTNSHNVKDDERVCSSLVQAPNKIDAKEDSRDGQKSEKIMVEFTDPNPFKEFHIGHLYSNTVGEAISRLFEATGHEVKRVCYQGDVGMHVAKSIWGMINKLGVQTENTLSDLNNLELSPLIQRVKFLGEAYALGSAAFEDSEQAKKEITNINVLIFVVAQENLQETTGWKPIIDYSNLLSDHKLDKDLVKLLYQKGRAWSLEAFEKIYLRLGTKFSDYYFESLVAEFGMQLVLENLEKGIFEKSKGATIFPGSKYGLHDRVFINSLGLPTYEAKELGLAIEKYQRYPYDRSYIITANEIDEYFKVLLCALQKVKPDLALKTHHLSHGMVRLPEGKMSSRKGNVLTGEWLIDESRERILKIVKENHPEFDPEEQSQISEVVGVGAVKFALLKVALGKDIAFSFESSLSFEGNSGPYIQYSYARCQSVLRKALEMSVDVSSEFDEQKASNLLGGLLGESTSQEGTVSVEERQLLHALFFFPEVVERCVSESAPHFLCSYLFELASLFNLFYSKHQILKSSAGSGNVTNSPDLQQWRLTLTKKVAQTLKHGLGCLGIETVERM